MLHMTALLWVVFLLGLGLARLALAEPAPAEATSGAEAGRLNPSVATEAGGSGLPSEGAPPAPRPGSPDQEKTRPPRGPSPQELSRQMQMSLRGTGFGSEGVKSAAPLKQVEAEKGEPAKVGPLIIGGTLAAEEARAAEENASRVLRRSDQGKQETYVGIAAGKGKEAEKEGDEREEGGRGRLEGVDFKLDRDNAKIKWIFKF